MTERHRCGDKLMYSIKEGSEILGVSKWMMKDEVGSGRLQTFKVGRRRFVTRRALEAWVEQRQADHDRHERERHEAAIADLLDG